MTRDDDARFPCARPSCVRTITLIRYQTTGLCNRCSMEDWVAELAALPEAPDEEYPAGTGPYGF